MNVPFGAYTDGSVKPGEKPTAGAHYDGPWKGGPSWEFFEVLPACCSVRLTAPKANTPSHALCTLPWGLQC